MGPPYAPPPRHGDALATSTTRLKDEKRAREIKSPALTIHLFYKNGQRFRVVPLN